MGTGHQQRGGPPERDRRASTRGGTPNCGRDHDGPGIAGESRVAGGDAFGDRWPAGQGRPASVNDTEPDLQSLIATRSDPTAHDSSSGAAPIPATVEGRGDLAVCTIVSKNYLAYARVLMRSFLEHHPGTPAFVLLVDRNDGYFDPDGEPFTVINLSEVGIPRLRGCLSGTR